jgi:hypothetical protein
MKKLEINILEKLVGGDFDCTAEGQLLFVAGGAAAGACYGGPFGFLGGLGGSLAYSIYKCYPFKK